MSYVFQEELVVKEENVPENRSEQQENEYHMKTDCDNEKNTEVFSLTKQRSHKTSLKLEKHILMKNLLNATIAIIAVNVVEN